MSSPPHPPVRSGGDAGLGVIALFRDQWLELPRGEGRAVYLTSAILIVAACSLILTAGDKHSEDS
jgi:hypothetical protein